MAEYFTARGLPVPRELRQNPLTDWRRLTLSAAALIASAAATHARLGGPGSWLLALPAHHVAGLQVVVRAALAGHRPAILALNGGFDPIAANAGKIYVIRGDYDAPNIFHLDASSPDALLLATAFQLKPRDVVFVSTYRLTQWNRVMSQILPTVQILYDAAISADIAARRF